MKLQLAILASLMASMLAAAEPLSSHPTLKQMHAASNNMRVTKGLAKHRLNEELTKAAQNHAWYMARMHDDNTEDFNHRGNNGTPGQRAAKTGYCGLVKENIARGYTSVDKTFLAWSKSSSHRDAIYSETVDAGFGYAMAKDGTTYWVVVYGQPYRSDIVAAPALTDMVRPQSGWWLSGR
jgi:uncharacterized protein YkwD